MMIDDTYQFLVVRHTDFYIPLVTESDYHCLHSLRTRIDCNLRTTSQSTSKLCSSYTARYPWTAGTNLYIHQKFKVSPNC